MMYSSCRNTFYSVGFTLFYPCFILKGCQLLVLGNMINVSDYTPELCDNDKPDFLTKN